MADNPITSDEHLHEASGKFSIEMSNRRGEEANGSSMT